VKCQGVTRTGRPCGAPWQLVTNGFCAVHGGRVDPVAIGAAGGVASGVRRREKAVAVRAAVADAEVTRKLERKRAELEQLEASMRESARWRRQSVRELRDRFVVETQARMAERFRDQRAKLRNLRRQRQRLERRVAA
jgi:hypothetical protein